VSLRFPYQEFNVGRPLVGLSGRWKRPRPLVTVALLGPKRSITRDALLDTGADDTVFPEAFASVGSVSVWWGRHSCLPRKEGRHECLPHDSRAN
jgi:hypothetical protein